MMTQTWNDHTKMAIRGAAVALTCIVISKVHAMDRSYWMFLTAFMLITLSFGEGIYRSLIRFVMTISGCLIGWLLYLPLQHSRIGLILLLLISLFLMIYWITRSLIGRTLATGVLVVASFSFMGGWTFHLLVDRIIDTFVGAIVAIVINGLVFPEFSKNTVKNSFLSLRDKLPCFSESLFNTHSLPELKQLNQKLQSLEKERFLLNQNYATAQYELFFRLKAKRRYQLQLTKINIIFLYLNSLINIKILSIESPLSFKARIAKGAENYYKNRISKELLHI